MNIAEIEQLIHLLRANGVKRFKSKDLRLDFGDALILPAQEAISPGPPLQAIPPVQAEIKHHTNEVKNLLKLSDEELVDRMFPDFTKEA